MTRLLAAFLILTSTVVADPPYIEGTPNVDAADNTIRVKVNTPPWLNLAVKDAPPEAHQTWTGPIGDGQVGFYTKDGVGVTTGIPGTFVFRVLLQVPKEGLDDVQFLESTVIVEGTGPPPPPPPVEDFSAKLTSVVKASKDKTGLDKVSGVYTLVADQIKTGLLTTPQQVTSMTALLASTASPAWADIDAKVVQPHLKTLTLKTAADYEPLWRQIAAAVKAGLTDTPPPPPIPVTSLHVLIIEEMDDRSKLPASQVNIFSSTKLIGWFNANGVKWRMFDDDVDQSFLDATWKAAMERPRQSLPWVVASNGTKGFEGPLPKTVDELTALLEQYK